MDGSPVRSLHKSSIAQLNQTKDVQGFQKELVRLIRADLPHSEVFIGIVDGDSKILQVPSWVRSHLDRHPGLAAKLEQGAMVGISHKEENPILRPAVAARSSVVLIPIINEDALQGAVGLISPLDGPHVSAEEVEAVRQLAHEAAPILVRLQEIESLARRAQEMTDLRERASRAEEALAKAIEERNHFDALLKIGGHVQANVAHELRTPLAAIRGYARMIIDGRGGEVNDTQRDYLRVINENTNRLINVASWMTHIAELSTQQFNLDPCDLRNLWSEAVHKNQQALSAKSIKLTERIPDDSFEIVADSEKLAYVLHELIAATVKLSDSQSAVTAELSRGREREVTLKIAATGPGIAPEVLNKFFDRSVNNRIAVTVQQSDDKSISLTAVYDIVGMHGGRMFVNSTPGQGFTFLFTLPAVTIGGEDKSHEQAVNFSRR